MYPLTTIKSKLSASAIEFGVGIRTPGQLRTIEYFEGLKRLGRRPTLTNRQRLKTGMVLSLTIHATLLAGQNLAVADWMQQQPPTPPSASASASASAFTIKLAVTTNQPLETIDHQTIKPDLQQSTKTVALVTPALPKVPNQLAVKVPAEQALIKPLISRPNTNRKTNLNAKPTRLTKSQPEPVQPSIAPLASIVQQPVASAQHSQSQPAKSDFPQQPTAIAVVKNPRYRLPPKPPHYPVQSIRRGQQGTALVRAKLNAAGAINHAYVYQSSGHPQLDQAALAAVNDWSFEPAISNGIAVVAWVEVPVNFRLH